LTRLLLKHGAYSLRIITAPLFRFSAAVLCISLLLAAAWCGLVLDLPLSYGEGPIIDQAVRLARFEHIYRFDLSKPPYVIANYPPVYHFLQLPFLWIFGPTFIIGRILSVTAVFGTAWLLAVLVKRLT